MTKPKLVVLAVVATTLVAFGSVPVAAQIPEIPAPPPPPAEVEPAVGAVSVPMFQACLAQASVAGVVQLASGVSPVHPPVSLDPVMDQVRNVTLLGVACEYFAPRFVPMTCDVDGTVPGAPIAVPQPASIVATEIMALETLLDGYGAPVKGQLTGPVNGQLGCSDN
jgi:hypothetical protein